MQHWETEYNGQRIRVENELTSERLVIDGAVRAVETGLATSRELHGEVRGISGSPEPVRVELNEGTDEGIACRIFVSDRLVYSSTNDRPS